MPGSTPATSQLDWLISTTAMIVLSGSNATRDLIKACPGAGRGRSAGASGHSVSYLPATMVPSPSPPAPYHLSGGGNRIRTIGPASGKVVDAKTRVGRTLTLGGGAESSLEGRDIELSVSPKDIRTSPYDLCAKRSDRRRSREGDRWFESTFLQGSVTQTSINRERRDRHV